MLIGLIKIKEAKKVGEAVHSTLLFLGSLALMKDVH